MKVKQLRMSYRKCPLRLGVLLPCLNTKREQGDNPGNLIGLYI